jgi:hypothetical protein
MNSPNCKHIQAELLDYLEQEMPADERERVAEHLTECSNCKQEYKGLRAMLNKAKNLAIEDPGEEFWQQLPQKVLAQVTRERHTGTSSPASNIVDLSLKRHSLVNQPSAKPGRRTDHAHNKTHRVTAALAVAATLLLVFNVMMFSPKSGFLWFDQTQFQTQINTKNLSILAQTAAHRSVASGDSARLGFVEQQRVDKAFVMGLLLAESFVYVNDNQAQLAVPRLQRLQQDLQIQKVSAVTLSSLRKTVEMLQFTDATREQAAELLRDFQRDYENFLAHTAPQQVVLYRAGIWVLNASLAVAAKDADAIAQLGEAAQLDYLQNAFLRINAPVGIQQSLQEIAIVSHRLGDRQTRLSDADYQSLQRTLENLYALLG